MYAILSGGAINLEANVLYFELVQPSRLTCWTRIALTVRASATRALRTTRKMIVQLLKKNRQCVRGSSRDTRMRDVRAQTHRNAQLAHVLRALRASHATPSRAVLLLFNAISSLRHAREPLKAILRPYQFDTQTHAIHMRLSHAALASFATAVGNDKFPTSKQVEKPSSLPRVCRAIQKTSRN